MKDLLTRNGSCRRSHFRMLNGMKLDLELLGHRVEFQKKLNYDYFNDSILGVFNTWASSEFSDEDFPVTFGSPTETDFYNRYLLCYEQALCCCIRPVSSMIELLLHELDETKSYNCDSIWIENESMWMWKHQSDRNWIEMCWYSSIALVLAWIFKICEPSICIVPSHIGNTSVSPEIEGYCEFFLEFETVNR